MPGLLSICKVLEGTLFPEASHRQAGRPKGKEWSHNPRCFLDSVLLIHKDGYSCAVRPPYLVRVEDIAAVYEKVCFRKQIFHVLLAVGGVCNSC